MLHTLHSKSYGAVSIQQLLDLHARTLLTIELGCYSPHVSIGDLPDLSNFSALRNLTVSNADLYADTPRIACSKLSGSALTHLTIDTGHGRFDDEHARWLTQFARWRHGDSRLREPLYVHVLIQRNSKRAHSGFCHESPEKKFQSSIRYLTDICSVSAECGVNLTWNKIFLTEAGWIQQVGQVWYGSPASQRINQHAEEKAKERQNRKTYHSKFTINVGLSDEPSEAANTCTSYGKDGLRLEVTGRCKATAYL